MVKLQLQYSYKPKLMIFYHNYLDFYNKIGQYVLFNPNLPYTCLTRKALWYNELGKCVRSPLLRLANCSLTHSPSPSHEFAVDKSSQNSVFTTIYVHGIKKSNNIPIYQLLHIMSISNSLFCDAILFIYCAR